MSLGVGYSERRQNLRVPVECEASVYGEGDMAWEGATCVNLSSSGVLVASTSDFALGSMMKVRVKPKLRLSSDLSAEMEVVRTFFDPERQRHMIGARFTYVER
jgi:hypothetical protein